jgi:hypothetical protein
VRVSSNIFFLIAAISLTGKKIGDDGAVALAEAIKINRSVTHLLSVIDNLFTILLLFLTFALSLSLSSSLQPISE